MLWAGEMVLGDYWRLRGEGRASGGEGTKVL